MPAWLWRMLALLLAGMSVGSGGKYGLLAIACLLALAAADILTAIREANEA